MEERRNVGLALLVEVILVALCYLESFSKVLKVVLLLWFDVFYPSLEFFSFEVSLVMIFLVSFLLLVVLFLFSSFLLGDGGYWI